MSIFSVARDNLDGGLLELGAGQLTQPARGRELSSAYMAVFPYDTASETGSQLMYRITPTRSFNGYSDGVMDTFVIHELSAAPAAP